MECTFLLQVLLALYTFIVRGDSKNCRLNLMSLLLAVLNKTCLGKSVTKLWEFCHMAVIMLCLFLTVLCVGLQCVIVVFPGRTHLL